MRQLHPLTLRNYLCNLDESRDTHWVSRIWPEQVYRRDGTSPDPTDLLLQHSGSSEGPRTAALPYEATLPDVHPHA